MTTSIRFTAQQQAILQSDHCSVAVSAGAGCGKTFVLTQRFIAHLRNSSRRISPLESVVAITFTDRAAGEMRHRVRVACEAELQACLPEDVSYWLGVLRGLDGARISTIHAFCSNLLRRFAVEAGLDPIFSQLDVSFGDIYGRRAVRRAFCRLLESDDADATQLVIRFGFERAESLIRELIEGSPSVDVARFDGLSPEDLLSEWRSCWTEQCLPELFEEFRQSNVVEQLLEVLHANQTSHPKMRERRASLIERLGPTQQVWDVDRLRVLREAAQVQGGGGKAAWSEENVYESVKNLLTLLREHIDRLVKQMVIAETDDMTAATLALMAHRVAGIADKEYRSQKLNDGTLDFEDLLSLSRNLLRDNPAARRRAIAGIELLMVDEFQDTDPVQAELVRLLCGDQLAHGRLFLVGDAKQSIYRFRRADPKVFRDLRNDLPEAGRLPLTVNFRSQPAILRFVNFTFAPEIDDYEPLIAKDTQQLSPEPSIEFLFPSTSDEDGNAEAKRRLEARYIARRLQGLLNDSTPRVRDLTTGELRPPRPGDFAILFRTLSNVHLYEQALQEQGLDYYLAGGRAFFAQQEVHDIANLCRWLEDPTDELSLAGVLRSPLFGLNDDTLLLLKPDRKRSFIDGLRRPPRLSEVQAEQVRRAKLILDELRAKKDVLRIADLLRLAIERTGYDAALLCEHLGKRKLANLRKLINVAESLDAAGSVTLSEFVFRLNQAVREAAKEELAATHPEVADVLRLMTIHQSKGLEFPVVILADMDWRRPGGDSKACYHRTLGPIFPIPDDDDGKLPHLGNLIHQWEQKREEEAEHTRLFYVAATRARDHLILSAGLESNAKPRSPWLKLLARRFDLMTGLPAADPYLGAVDGTAKSLRDLPNVLVHHGEPACGSAHSKNAKNRLPLSKFRDGVAQSTPVPLPPIMGRITSDESRRDEFSISEICHHEQFSEPDLDVQHPTPFELSPAFQDLLDSSIDLPRFAAGETSRQIGVVAHRVLEQIDFRSLRREARHDLMLLAERTAISLFGRAEAPILRAVVERIEVLLSSSLRQELADSTQLYREIEFRLHLSDDDEAVPAVLMGTIDCLFEDARGWHILDYKTSLANDGRSAASQNAYRLQVLSYGLAFSRLFGHPPASLRLVRLGPPLTVEPIEMETGSIEWARQRINTAIASLRHR